MKSLNYVLLAAGALSLAACVTREREVVHNQPIVRERTVVHDAPPPAVVREHDVVIANDVHQTWWNSYHPGEMYDPSRAMAAHRLFCADHPSDSTCAGWDWR
jgi:hypothetical protein